MLYSALKTYILDGSLICTYNMKTHKIMYNLNHILDLMP